MKSDVLGEQPFLSQKKLLSIINFQKTVRSIVGKEIPEKGVWFPEKGKPYNLP